VAVRKYLNKNKDAASAIELNYACVDMIVMMISVVWLCVSGSGSSKRLAKKDAALAMLQYISDGGEMEMSVSRLSVDGNQELGQHLSEVNGLV